MWFCTVWAVRGGLVGNVKSDFLALTDYLGGTEAFWRHISGGFVRRKRARDTPVQGGSEAVAPLSENGQAGVATSPQGGASAGPAKR